MPKIEITELDLTTPGVIEEKTDVVFIPGFVDITQGSLQNDKGEYVGLEQGVPHLFTSLGDFTALCGTEAPIFNVNQPYPESFAEAAIPSGNNIYFAKVGDPDPSYVMAKELLAAGLPVLYQRINGNETDGNVTDYKPVTADIAKNLIGTQANSKSPYHFKDSDGNYKPYNTKIEELSGEEYKVYEKDNIFEMTTVVTSMCSVSAMYDALEEIFSISDDPKNQNVSGLIDKGNYDIKYLTSGGYPAFEYTGLPQLMINLAKKRGDCVALIDHTNNPSRELNPHSTESVYSAVVGSATDPTGIVDGDFGAMFTPWATYVRTTATKNESKTFDAPGSFAYLMSLADSIKTNANWLAIAGATRGVVKNLYNMPTVIPNGVADTMQTRDEGGVAINAITNIKPYGYTIWGNRTLKVNKEDLVATNFLNIRNLISDVKKKCYKVARKATFEQDTDVLWINFKSEIAKLLDRMKSGYGISGYKIIRDTERAEASRKATLCAKIILYPTYAVEDFYISVILKDEDVTVE